MSTETTVAISIGRKIAGEPMPTSQWDAFQAKVASTLVLAGANVLFQGMGQGFWKGEPEGDSATWLAIVADENLPLLEGRLRFLARHFNQEAIGFLTTPADSSLLFA